MNESKFMEAKEKALSNEKITALEKAEELLRFCLKSHILEGTEDYNKISNFLNRNKPKIKIPEDLYERLQAVKTIVSTSCSYEEAQCAYEELEHILDNEFTIY